MTQLDPESPTTQHPEQAEEQMSFQAIARTPDFLRLRSSFRGFAFPMTIAGLTSYFVYVVLSIFLPEFMATPLLGAFSIGMLLGLAQFAVTWIWTAIYVNFADKRLDPLANTLKTELEGTL